jgi:hypothetical protein
MLGPSVSFFGKSSHCMEGKKKKKKGSMQLVQGLFQEKRPPSCHILRKKLCENSPYLHHIKKKNCKIFLCMIATLPTSKI